MKKFLFMIILCVSGLNAFGDDFVKKSTRVEEISIPRNILESVLQEDSELKNHQDLIQKMMNKFDIYTGIHNLGKIDIDDIAQICLLGNISRKDDCWTRILNPVLTKMKTVRFADVCIGENVDITGGERHCIDDVFVIKSKGKNSYHQNVNIPEYTAYGLALEYAKKKGHDVWCKENKEHKNTIRCSTLDNSHFYTFKFDGTNNTDDNTILENTIKGICALQDAKFVDSGFKNITADGHMGLNINWEEKDGCMTQCDASLLDKFALHGKTERRSFKWLDNNLHDFCPIDTLHKFDENLLSKYPGYEYMTNAFENIQFVLDNNLVNTIRSYIELQGINVSSFSCKYRAVPYQSNSLSNYGRAIDNDVLITVGTAMEMAGEPDDVLICELNGKKVDFVFDDLYESKNYEQKAGKAGLACVLANGTYGSDRNCRNLTKSQCLEASSKIPGGTSWNSDSEVCVLNNVANAKTINNIIQISSGIAIAVGVTFLSGGTATIAIVAAGSGLLLDTAFIGIEKINELRPAHRARSFAKDVQNCQIPDSTISCSTAQKNCAWKVVNSHFAALEEIFTELNDDQMNVIGDLMENVTNCLSDEEFQSALETSTTYATASLNTITWVLLIGGMFVNPESSLAKLAQRSPKIAKVLTRGRVIEMTKHSANGIEYARFAVDHLNKADMDKFVENLVKEGNFVSGGLADGKKIMYVSKQRIFDTWDNSVNNWMLSTGDKIDNILRKFNKKSVFRSGKSNTLHKDYYRIMINDGDDVEEMLGALQKNGYVVSSGTTDKQRFLAVSDEDVFGEWDNVQGNWLRNGIRQPSRFLSDNGFSGQVGRYNVYLEDLPTAIGGTSKIINIHGRAVVVVNINGHRLPYYVSSGQAGKDAIGIASGRWYPIAGIGVYDGDFEWFNKMPDMLKNPVRTMDDIEDRLSRCFNPAELKQLALAQKEIPKASLSAANIINSEFPDGVVPYLDQPFPGHYVVPPEYKDLKDANIQRVINIFK